MRAINIANIHSPSFFINSDKLIKVVTKTVSRIGPLATFEDFNGVYMPYDKQTDSTTGVCLVEYETAEVG